MRPMTPAPATLLWHPDRSPDGRRNDRWFVAKRDMPACGGVWRELGRYRAEAWPAGSKSPPGAYYATRATAQRHLERWLRAHTHVLELDVKGHRGTKAKPPPLPDWRIAQYLRVNRAGEGRPAVGST